MPCSHAAGAGFRFRRQRVSAGVLPCSWRMDLQAHGAARAGPPRAPRPPTRAILAGAPPWPLPPRAQVYDGSHADWTETDRCSPVNAYGRTKLEAEQYVRTHWVGGPGPAPRAGRACKNWGRGGLSSRVGRTGRGRPYPGARRRVSRVPQAKEANPKPNKPDPDPDSTPRSAASSCARASSTARSRPRRRRGRCSCSLWRTRCAAGGPPNSWTTSSGGALVLRVYAHIHVCMTYVWVCLAPHAMELPAPMSSRHKHVPVRDKRQSEPGSAAPAPGGTCRPFMHSAGLPAPTRTPDPDPCAPAPGPPCTSRTSAM
jgi:hypothetical protein